jgi:TonB family protein
MSHRWLVAVSVTAHFCILAGVFVSGIWRMERLEAGPRKFELHVQPPPPPPAPAGGSRAPRPPDFVPKRPPRVVNTVVQPPAQVDTTPVEQTRRGDGDGSGSGSGDPRAIGTCTENCGDGPPAEPVCGNGSVEAGEQCDDGNTASGDGCSATCGIEVRPPPTATVAPSVLAGLRISGQTQVHPDQVTQNQMIRDGAGKAEAVVKLCIAADGSVGSTRLLRSTRYAEYDAALVAAVAGWRYQPYRLNGAAVPACSTVRFVYTIQ